MARGRKPDSAETQALKGNPRKSTTARRASDTLDPVIAGKVVPPRWLKKSRTATEVWNSLAPLLSRLNALTQLDAFPLARYCRYVVDWVAADEAVRKEGVYFNALDTNGSPTKKRHPAFQARKDLERDLEALEEAFSMRPDARFKMLRDQALAPSMGPLFGAGDDKKPEPSADKPEAPQANSAVGYLQ